MPHSTRHYHSLLIIITITITIIICSSLKHTHSRIRAHTRTHIHKMRAHNWIFEIQCNNSMAGCQKQSLNQRPLPLCSAGIGSILNWQSNSSKSEWVRVRHSHRKMSPAKRKKGKPSVKIYRAHISVTFTMCHYFHFSFFAKNRMQSNVLFCRFRRATFYLSFCECQNIRLSNRWKARH